MKENSETNRSEQEADDRGHDPEEDLLDDDDDGEPSPGVIVSLSRGVGAVARTVTDGIQTVSEALMPRRHVARRPSPDDLPVLLEQLGDLVAAHRDKGYANLADVEDFWRLVAKLSMYGRRKRLARAPEPVRRRTVKRVLDVEPGPPRKRAARSDDEPDAAAEETSGRRSKKSKKSADEGDEPKESEE